ncbi:TonB-dependent receptor [Gluconacetobacter azotocaptans]|uniref:TonB-dependent receptor plug domain-containing protein n=1 Tax=Gluconacetobacter azotocaptans TaxID=142834 RepID=UPI00195A0B19|nr:TonB-dependent receptor [Gluconacetobacter azotocaptans]MBM9403466.1 TonB-dependent receptor [Gluconacetobacter azotocaptans]
MASRHSLLLATACFFGCTGAALSPSDAEPLQTSTKPAKHAARPSGAPAAYHPPADASEAVIVTGTHATNRRARDSASPIAVVSAATLRRSGQMNLADALTRTYASINISAKGSDTAALTSSIRMRGLNPNQVLVLVDGKRRHVTGNIVQNSGPQFGATPVDLNMIPANMIDHVEVLEDGAAAMYGSDAIAGVVNIITKKQDHGLNVSAQTGANAYNGDGWQYQVNADGGLKLGNDGYVHLSGQVYHTDHFVAGAKDHRLLGYWPTGANTNGYYAGVVRNAMPVPTDSNKIMSTPEETRENLGIDFGKPIAEKVDFYGQITYAHRHAEAIQNYRIPTIAPSLYPWGFSPLETIEENDYAALLGVKGHDFFGFDWDLSTVYGADEDIVGNKHTANTGMLGATCNNGNVANVSTEGCGWSPTTVRSLSYRNAQWTNNLDFRRRINIFNTVPMVLAFGGEHRLETYEIVAGSPPSYQVGGTQGYAGLGPQSAGSWSRDIWAAYIDGDFHPVKRWDLDFAGRFEHYTDVGNAENGKVSTRVDITSRIAVRGTISTGFRAPTMAEQHYSTMSVSPTSASGLLPVSSSAAQSLGASPLQPERAVSASGGLVVEPVSGFHVEADAYQINLRNRIGQGGVTKGAAAVSAIQAMGYALPVNSFDIANVSTYYFANGASTRTQGLDIKADYTFHLHRYGNLALSMALDLNRTRLHHNGLSQTGMPLLNEQTIGYLTTAYPRSKIILNLYYTVGNWDVNLRQTRYGETTDMMTYQDWTNGALQCPAGGALRYSNSCFAQFKNTPRWLTDLEIGYRLDNHWHFAVGGNNLFNIRPRRLPEELSSYGAAVYDQNAAQVPINGGYYYGRINATF